MRYRSRREKEREEKALARRRGIPTEQTVYSIPQVQWPSCQRDVFPWIMTRCAVKAVRPWVQRYASLPQGCTPACDITAVQFQGHALFVDLPWYFEKLHLRLATFAELIRFGATYPEIKKRHVILQFGTLFDISNGPRAGAGFINDGEVPTEVQWEPSLFVRFHSFEEQADGTLAGDIVLGVSIPEN